MKSQEKDFSKTLNFPHVERRVFETNFLDTVIIELRFPTFLRLKEREPTDISESIRARFPLYEAGKEMQMTPLGTTDPEPIYKFATRSKDPIVTISASNMALTTKRYRSFSDFSGHLGFLLDMVVPKLDTNFFTRVGLRYINHIYWGHLQGEKIIDWINEELIGPITGAAIRNIDGLKSELTGPLPQGGKFTLRYALPSPANQSPNYVLDWDYYTEDIEIEQCEKVLRSFHDIHFPFFWWALGQRAREALDNGDVRRS